MRNFTNDLQDSHKTDWFPVLKREFGDKIQVRKYDDSKDIQQGVNIDCVVMVGSKKVGVEFKTRNSGYYEKDMFCLEIAHHRTPFVDHTDLKGNTVKVEGKVQKKEGWFYQTQAQALFFATISEDKTKVLEYIKFNPNYRNKRPYCELYNLIRDPDEFENLALNNEYKQIKNELQEKLLSLLKYTKDPVLNGEVPAPKRVENYTY